MDPHERGARRGFGHRDIYMSVDPATGAPIAYRPNPGRRCQNRTSSCDSSRCAASAEASRAEAFTGFAAPPSHTRGPMVSAYGTGGRKGSREIKALPPDASVLLAQLDDSRGNKRFLATPPCGRTSGRGRAFSARPSSSGARRGRRGLTPTAAHATGRQGWTRPRRRAILVALSRIIGRRSSGRRRHPRQRWGDKWLRWRRSWR